MTKGWQPTLERYKKSYDSREKMGVLSFSELEITLTGKDSAVVFGRFTLEREKDKPTGLFTLNFRKFKDGLENNSRSHELNLKFGTRFAYIKI